MKKNVFKSKAFNLAVTFSMLIAVIIIAFVVLFVFLLRRNYRKRQEILLAVILENVEKQGMEKGLSSIYSGDLPDIPYFVSLCIYEKESKETLFTNDPFIVNLPETKDKSLIYLEKNYFIDGDLNVLYRTRNFVCEGMSLVVQASINMDRDYAVRILYDLFLTILLFSVPLILVSFLSSYAIIKSTINPVKKMARTAESMDFGNSTHFEIAGSDDEFDDLARTFNKLFEKIKEDFERERQFTADVSHELKTPLSVISGHANLIRRWGKDDPVQLEKSINRLNDEVHSMQMIIENLLQISRLERGTVKFNRTNVAIGELVQRLKEDTEAWAVNSEVIIGNMDTDSIFCDSELLYEAMTIIVSNSVKYSDPDFVTIKIEEKVTDRGTELSIKDNGPGIKPEALPHVMKRFYRGDESHNRGKKGNGLGLSIVKSIMDVHNGEVQIFSDGCCGTTVTLIFPKERNT